MAKSKMNDKQPVGSVELLRLVTEERKSFGVKQLDYHRYHAHCAKKLHAMRRAGGIQQINKNKKFLKKTLKPPFISSQNLKLQHILVVLFEAERCWAASRELKQTVTSLQTKRTVTGLASASSNTQTRKTGLSKLRSHARTRLSRAVKHASSLLSFNTLVPFETHSLIEVHVYNLHLQGLLAFDLGKWTTGLDCLSLAVTLLKALSKHAHGSRHKDVALFQEWSDNTLPLVRYCAYKLEISTLTDIETFSEERTEGCELGPKLLGEHWEVINIFIADSQKTETSDSISLSWRGQSIPSRSLDLVEIVLQVQDATQKLKEALSSPTKPSKISHPKDVKVSKPSTGPGCVKSTKSVGSRSRAFDAALLVYTDTEESIQTLVKASQRALESNESFQHSNDQHISLTLNHSVIAFRLLSTRFQRDLDLLEGLKTKLKRRELKVERRLSSKSGHQTFQLIDALVSNEKNQKPTNKKEMQNIRRKMMNRQRANIYPSLLKLYDSILLDLEKMRQLTIIDDDDSLASMVDCRLAFYQAHRCLIQSRSYHLIEKFPESFALHQKSILYLRESERALREADVDEDIEDQEEELISLITNPEDISALTQIQEETKREILRDWYEDCQSDHHPILHELEAEIKLGMLSLSGESPDLQFTQPTPGNKPDQPALDVAYNYVIDFPLDQLAIKASLKQPDHSNSQRAFISAAAIPSDAIPTSHEEVVVPAETKKSGGGLWSFFTGRWCSPTPRGSVKISLNGKNIRRQCDHTESRNAAPIAADSGEPHTLVDVRPMCLERREASRVEDLAKLPQG
ncbi:uncharacterized protein MELLADRAFT_117696 [Melampsora larici-populina 98AG31]|uniref:Signal recognition particle subunit SRP68 n=1 Tax=Melampsora larici-populina (strain 98AG31 / pathotype 3-4-7) TaxID=747676 RepID=F4S0G8_MELLP|nr:uncharacterized protein MELLADRAFT_117696 [Melampsora larici-populina 98AG31]EGG01764.1 hypothetical protein MELLADRAFT_117696 [Melampsora larici-populina 98AG31]